MDTERQKENGMSDYNRFFKNSWERFIEIVSDVKEVAASEDIKAIRERVEDLKEMSDGFQKIDVNKLSDNEKKFCKHFTKALDRISGLYNRIWTLSSAALDRISGLYNRILDTFERGEVSNSAGLKLVFAFVKDLSLASRNLTIAKKYIDREEDPFCEMTR